MSRWPNILMYCLGTDIDPEKVGEIDADFTFLRDQGLIRPIQRALDEKGKPIGKQHYRVNYTMVIKVSDRDLSCEYLSSISLRTPPRCGRSRENMGLTSVGYAVYNGQIRQRCRLNIASAFDPGVK